MLGAPRFQPLHSERSTRSRRSDARSHGCVTPALQVRVTAEDLVAQLTYKITLQRTPSYVLPLVVGVRLQLALWRQRQREAHLG